MTGIEPAYSAWEVDSSPPSADRISCRCSAAASTIRCAVLKLMPDALAAAVIDAPLRLAASTAITVSTGCVVTPDAISSDARSASSYVASVCAESCTVCAGSGCTDAVSCARACRAVCARVLVGATGLTWDFALRCGVSANRCTAGVCAPEGVVAVRVRRAGLSPSATNIRVLTATAVSMIAGNIHAHAGGVPVWISRSRRVRKLSMNAPAPMTATAAIAQCKSCRMLSARTARAMPCTAARRTMGGTLRHQSG